MTLPRLFKDAGRHGVAGSKTINTLMRNSMRTTTAFWAALAVSAAVGGTSVSAQNRPTGRPAPSPAEPRRDLPPANEPRPAAPAGAGDVAPAPIPGLTDKIGLDAKRPSELLGDLFESAVTGIAFRPPANSRQIKKADSDAESMLEFETPERGWLLKVTRAKLAQALPLQTVKDKGRDKVGLLDYTVQEVKQEHPLAEILRQEIVNVGEHGVGVLAVRLVIANERFLRQQAIFQINEQLYYVFNLTTKAAKVGAAQDDANERLAVETFKAMLDTIQPLDRAWIKEDQVQRLFRTRALFTDWSDKGGRRLKQAVVPEQWLRILRNGKDIGYSYVVEEFVEGKDVKNNPARAHDGVLVSVRSRTVADGGQVDVGSQMFTSLDRKHEDWAHIVNLVADKGKPNEEKKQTNEFGYSETRLRRVAEPREDKPAPNEPDPNIRDPRNPAVRNVESYALRVERAARGRNANDKPEVHAPSPWYIPQAVGSMLPRLLPLHRPVTYLFQTYVGEQHQVVHRYVDVGFQKKVTLNGEVYDAIPISDRIRLEGTPTIHYMSPSGRYIGSVNDEAKITILVTDKATVERIWKNADLTRPADVANPAAAASTGARGGSPSGGSPSASPSNRN
jgi:hypothetical protein